MTCMQHNIEQHISTKVTLSYYICWPAKLQETKLQKPCIVLVKMLNLNIFNLLFSSKNLPKPNKTAHYLYSIYTCRKEGGCTISHGRQGSPALFEPLCLGGGVLPVRTESCAQWQSSLKSAQHITNIGNTLGFQNFQDRLWEKQQIYLFGLRVIFPQLWHSSITSTATFITASKKSLYTVSR